MKLDLRDIEIHHRGYIYKIIMNKLPRATDEQHDRVYRAVLKSLRKKAEKGYELKAKYGVKSLRTFLKRITLRRVIDYLRKRSEDEQAGWAEQQVDLDVNQLGAMDENIESFLKHGPRERIRSVGGIEIKPILDKIPNKLMWITWGTQLELNRQIEQEQAEGWLDAMGRRVATDLEIKRRIAKSWGISPEAVRLRIYRAKKKCRKLWEQARRFQWFRLRLDMSKDESQKFL